MDDPPSSFAQLRDKIQRLLEAHPAMPGRAEIVRVDISPHDTLDLMVTVEYPDHSTRTWIVRLAEYVEFTLKEKRTP